MTGKRNTTFCYSYTYIVYFYNASVNFDVLVHSIIVTEYYAALGSDFIQTSLLAIYFPFFCAMCCAAIKRKLIVRYHDRYAYDPNLFETSVFSVKKCLIIIFKIVGFRDVILTI